MKTPLCRPNTSMTIKLRLVMTLSLFLVSILMTSFLTAGPCLVDHPGKASEPDKASEPGKAFERELEILPDSPNRMIFIEGGTFQMGDRRKDGAEDELPVHEVRIDCFFMSRFEISVLEFKTFCKETGREMPPVPEWGWIDHHPVVNVSWNDADSFCVWLSAKTGLNFRLPTEAEWEYCARDGGKDINYPTGEECLPEDANFEKYDSWSKDETIPPTFPAGSFRPNSLGLYNMTANVHEWVLDRYAADYYSKAPKNNPGGPETGEHRVGRGGSWRSPREIGRCANRNYGDPSFQVHNSGFRIALSLLPR